MRLVRLGLEAFGPFSDRMLVFGEPTEPGLCVVHGANEAGKSSALRAIRGLFYGIPHQTDDDFVHRQKDLRIAAELHFEGGLRGEVVRRKGLKGTLVGRDASGAEVALRLEALTQAVPEAVFAHFYGLDHRGLALGSRALLEDGGELGRALFGAGLGIVHLRQLIERLEGEAAALYVSQGKKQRIPLAVAEWKELQSAIRSDALDPTRFEEQARTVDGLSTRLTELQTAAEVLRAELSRQRRLKDARVAFDRAVDERRDAEARLAREIEREAAIVLSPVVLAALEPIEALHQALGAYRDTREHLPRREETAALLESEIAALTTSLGHGFEAAPGLQRIAERARGVRALVADGARFEDRLVKAVDAEREARALWTRLADEGAAEEGAGDAREPEPLVRALSRAQKLGPIDAQIELHARQRQELVETCRRAERQLALGDATGEQLETLPLPSSVEIERHARRFAQQAEVHAQRREKRRVLVEERLAVDEALGRLQAEGQLPSEAELEAARRARDEIWAGLRDRLLAPVGSPAAGPAALSAADSDDRRALQEIAAGYDERVREADRLADRLRAEAERVARGAALVAQAARLDASLEQLECALEDDRAALDRLAGEWQAIWPEAVVGSGPIGLPETRLEWRARVDALFGLYERLRELDGSLAREGAVRDEARRGIAAELADDEAAATPESARLETWIERAELALDRRTAQRARARDRAQALAQAEAQRDRATRDREQAEVALARWREAWAAELAALSLPPDTAPRDVEAHLETMLRLREARTQLDEARLRVEKMRADALRFEDECRRLVERCLPAIADFEAVPAALRLKRELEQARTEATRAEAARIALAEARDGLAAAERRRQTCDEALRALAGEGAGDGDDALDLDRLSARIATLDERLLELDRERGALHGQLGRERAALEAMDGNARQAERAEQAEARRAQVLADVERYAELVIARQLLEQEIDAYRRANQGPLLERTGRLFAALTRGAYTTVLSDAGDDGKGRLLALGASQREVHVEALSAGTRDQLFLALRLASLEASLERGEPMPLVADDILIEFDDERTRATLEVLAELARRTQILLFTHHRHVADFARDLGARARVVEL